METIPIDHSPMYDPRADLAGRVAYDDPEREPSPVDGDEFCLRRHLVPDRCGPRVIELDPRAHGRRPCRQMCVDSGARRLLGEGYRTRRPEHIHRSRSERDGRVGSADDESDSARESRLHADKCRSSCRPYCVRMASTEQIVIRQLPTGALAPTDFEVRIGELPELGEDEVLVRVVAITIGAGQRAGLQGSASYAGLSVSGVVMTGTGVGIVEQSTAAGISVGDLVVGPTGWTRHAVLRARETRIVSPTADPGDHLGVFGTNGLTAYFGLFDIGRPVPGDTVLVSAAAGSVGHLVGQMAKQHGCRVVGVAGSEAKCTMLIDELGFDAALNRSADDFRDHFRAATPDRINVYFDNTGGDILGSALFRMATHGRIVCCGAVSAYDTSNPDRKSVV